MRNRIFWALTLLIISAAIPGYSEFEPTPETLFTVTQPLFMQHPYPADMSAVPAASAVVFLEVESGLCCELLKDRIRVAIDACTAPQGTGFKIGDTGVEYVDDFRTFGESYLPGIKVDIPAAGCSLPIDGSQVEVSVTAEARTPLGGNSMATYNWTFFSTGSSSTSPPPAANQPPPFEIQSVSPTPLVPGQPSVINGRGFASATQLLFNTEVIDSTFNTFSRAIQFRVPEGLQCGDHSIQLRNPGGEREYSNMLTFEITQNCESPTFRVILPTPRLDDPLAIDSLFQESGSPGDNVIVNGSGFIADSRVYFNREGLNTTYIGPDSLRFTVPPGTPCGRYDVYVRNKTAQSDLNSNTMTYSVNIGCQQAGSGSPPPGEEPPNEDPPPNNPPPNENPPPPPPPANADEVEEFDTDSDCEISNSEFFAAVNTWLAGSLDNGLFFSVLDAWISQSNVCSAAVSSTKLVMLSATLRNGIIFATESGEISAIAISIYDLDGKRIFASRTAGTKLSWNLRDSKGQQVSNGVYLFRAVIADEKGRTISTAARKFIVQR